MKRGCERLFGKQLKDMTDQTRKLLFEPTQKSNLTSDIYFSNGSDDPFSSLGIALEFGTWVNPNVYAHVTPGGTHGDDLWATYEPTEAHKAAHAQIRLLLQKWSLK